MVNYHFSGWFSGSVYFFIYEFQFGVFEYLLLSPVREEKDGIFTEDDLQMIQSGVEVAFANSEW